MLEKEAAPGLHQSTRNSGVIHAGYNAKPGSLKARFCVEGNRRLREYCLSHGVAVREGGILVVAKSEGEISVLRQLGRRAAANGVKARMLDGAGLRGLEPHAAGVAALQAPEGASFDAAGYVAALVEDASKAGAVFRFGLAAREIREESGRVVVHADGRSLHARSVVNCGGLNADRLAARLAEDLRVIPFRGYYAELVPPRRHLVGSHIYPVPDLELPFLGVHLSRRVDGRVLVGPGAMLAFGREAYRFHQFRSRDLADTLLWPGFYRLLARPAFRRLVAQEVLKSLRLDEIGREARALVPELRAGDLAASFAGNRAQLVSRDGNLVEDVVVRTTRRSVHVLNAVSPGLTCSLPFGEHVADECDRLRVW